MKKSIVMLILIYASLSVYAQDKDLEAQFLYTKAEETYTKALYPESIAFCEQAAGKLGKTNAKILSLELQAYHSLLLKQCYHRLLGERTKVDNYLQLYFDEFSKTANKEQTFAVMSFREKWNEYKKNGCPESSFKTWQQFNFGLNFTKTVYYGKYSPFAYIDQILPGDFKNQTSIREGFMVWMISVRPAHLPDDKKAELLTPYNDGLTHVGVIEKFNEYFKILSIGYPEMKSVVFKLYGTYRRGGEFSSYEVKVPVNQE